MTSGLIMPHIARDQGRWREPIPQHFKSMPRLFSDSLISNMTWTPTKSTEHATARNAYPTE